MVLWCCGEGAGNWEGRAEGKERLTGPKARTTSRESRGFIHFCKDFGHPQKLLTLAGQQGGGVGGEGMRDKSEIHGGRQVAHTKEA